MLYMPTEDKVDPAIEINVTTKSTVLKNEDDENIEADTIAAIATAHGTGAIGIIKVSGPRAFQIAEAVFSGKRCITEIKSHTVLHGYIVDPVRQEKVDEVILLKMDAPNTYTREDVVEIQCHAGMDVQVSILRLVIQMGARPAEPGEFTKRAFLNGRLDLSQAEAVMDLIRSTSEMGTKAAMSQLEGKLSKALKNNRNKLLDLIAALNVVVDFPEHEIDEMTVMHTLNSLSEIEEELRKLSDSFRSGRVARDGITAAIAGKPNVGKSTLLNQLIGRDRAIVSAIPGTTRDVLEESVNIGGFSVRFVDTAGIRETSDVIEKIGVEKAIDAIEKADFIIMVFDAKDGIQEEDVRIFQLVQNSQNKKTIFLVNKTDLADFERIKASKAVLSKMAQDERLTIIETSLKSGDGVEKLEAVIREMFHTKVLLSNNEAIVTNIRHYTLVQKSIDAIQSAITAVNSGLPIEMPIIDMQDALSYIGEITGEECLEEIIDRIFSNFCVGK